MNCRVLGILLLVGNAPAHSQVPPTATVQATPGKPAAVEGRVINAVTGEPLRKVALVLHPSGRPTGGQGGAASAASSDAEGRFRFENLRPGAYLLTGEKAGFVRQSYTTRRVSANPFNGTPIQVSSGQNVTGIEFKLTPQGVITGRVTDEDGEPVPRASVSAIRLGAAQTGNSGGTGTNDVGEFRLSNLAAGKYRVVVQRPGSLARGAIGRGGGGLRGPAAPAAAAETESYVPTYYPGVLDENQAAAIEISPGQEIGGVNIQLQKTQVFRVRGRVTGLPPRADGERMPGPRVILQPAGRRSLQRIGANGASTGPDGSFDVANVSPGSYDVIVMSFGRGGGGAIGRGAVSVGNADVDDVIVPALGLVDVSGVVRMEGDDKFQATGSVRLQSLTGGFGGGAGPSGGGGGGPMNQGAPGSNGKIEAGNSFALAGIGRDRFVPQLQPMPAGAYIKAIKVGSQESTDFTIDLTASPQKIPVEILLSAKAASVDGVVLDGDQPFDSAGIVVVPDPLDPSLIGVRGKTAVSATDGKFTVEGLAPGDYKVYALDEPVNLRALDAETLRPFEPASVSVKLKESGRESIKLNVGRLK